MPELLQSIGPYLDDDMEGGPIPRPGQVTVQDWEPKALRRYAAEETACGITESLGARMRMIESPFLRGELVEQIRSLGIVVHIDSLPQTMPANGGRPASTESRSRAIRRMCLVWSE